MEIERIDPDGLASRPFYHHVVRSSSRFLVHVSGQVGIDTDGEVVGGPDDFAAHVEQASVNLDLALAAAGVGRADVVKVTSFIVGYDHETRWPIIKAAHSSFFSGAIPAWTVVGVEALARPDLLIEIEATAASDRSPQKICPSEASAGLVGI
jgi:enamine deaminase RidA (YjgF/YER057c/UK114 family)